MRKILKLFSPVIIGVKINKQAIFALIAFWHFVISSLVRLIKQVINAVLNSCNFVINSLFRINKRFAHEVVPFFSTTIVSSSGFVTDSLVRINKQIISGVVNGALNSLGAIVSFLGATIDTLASINKQLINGAVGFLGAFLYSLGAIVNSFSTSVILLGAVIAAVTASLVRINKKLIYGVVRGVANSLSAVLSSLDFVLTSLVRINKQVIHATLIFPRFVITGLIKITKQVIHAIPTSLRKILLTYLSFVIVTLVVIVAFVTATNYIQLAVAIILYPPLVYFSFKVFPRKTRSYSRKPATAIQSPVKSAEKAMPVGRQAETGERENISIADIDKRAFLKLIGGTGFILFLMSIFNKNAGGLFPGIAPAGSGLTLLKDTAGNKIDPAQNQPLDGYRISEIDDSTIAFYGFINKDGAWFIMKGDTDTGSFRYSRGDSNFPGNWTNRENLKYDYFSNVFRP